jgi:hypothetical protein
VPDQAGECEFSHEAHEGTRRLAGFLLKPARNPGRAQSVPVPGLLEP